MLNYIDTTHQDPEIRLSSIILSCTAVETKYPTSKPITLLLIPENQDNKKMDGALESFDDSLKGLHESIARPSTATDAFGARF